MNSHPDLSRRERQIMDILYQKGRATAAEVMDSLSDPPGYSAIRSHLATLEKKGHVRHEKDGPKYVFIPILHPKIARRSAVRQLLRTFFGGSRDQAVAELLAVSPGAFSAHELHRLAHFI